MKMVEVKVIENMVDRLVAEFQPEKVLLFGSRAWGGTDDDSDVDLMVIVSESHESPSERGRRAHRCLRGIGVAADVLVRTRREFDRFRAVYASLEAEVLERGIVLYG